MHNHIDINSLSAISHDNRPVITTELLAQLYNTDPVRIRQNHHENKTRFVAGKHFFKISGEELKNLRVVQNYSQDLQPSLRGLQISPKTRSLILWTERGAARHAKMLETDQAWEIFELLEDHYFNTPPKTQQQQKQLPEIAAKSAQEHEKFKTAPVYRSEARDYVCDVLAGCQAFAEEHGISMADWVPIDRDKAASGLLADLLYGIKAELTFSASLEPQFKILPAGAVHIMPTDQECMKAVVERVVSPDILAAMLQVGIARLAAGIKQ